MFISKTNMTFSDVLNTTTDEAETAECAMAVSSHEQLVALMGEKQQKLRAAIVK